MQCTDDDQWEIHAEVEYLKQLWFSKGKHDHTTNFGQCDTTKYLEIKWKRCWEEAETLNSETYRTTHFSQCDPCARQSVRTFTDGEISGDVRTEFDCDAHRLEMRQIRNECHVPSDSLTMTMFTTEMAFSSMCQRYITPNISMVIIKTHRMIKNAVWKSKPSSRQVTRNTAVNDKDRFRIRLCQIVKYWS